MARGRARQARLQLDPKTEAEAANRAFIRKIQQRASKTEDAVLGPCLRIYEEQIANRRVPEDLLRDLTRPFVSANEETRESIRRRMIRKWPDDPERVEASVTNSLRRSAGTNFQALVSYALALYLIERGSAWYLQPPRILSKALVIRFTAGLPLAPDGDGRDEYDQVDDVVDAVEVEGETQEAVKPTEVAPDIDILLRNAGWSEQLDTPEPVLLLSAKTSLVDRGGQAARWKTYFDQATRPCPHRDLPDCAYTRLGITMENAGRFDILHGIVTANIYKMWFHDERYQKGELNSGQTRSNTYMFDLKLTTREDDKAETPPDWQFFPYIGQVLNGLSKRHKLPQ